MVRIFFSVLLFFLCGCSKAPPPAKQVLRLNLAAEPSCLDPRRVNDATSATVLKMLFEGLTRIDPSGKPVLAAAEEVFISPDRKEYLFQLRDCLWSNGDPVTAYDFEYAWRSILSPDFPAPHASHLYVLKGGAAAKRGEIPVFEAGVKALNEKTLLVLLEHPVPYFLEVMAFPTFFPVHKAIAEQSRYWALEAGPLYVSNGAFRLDSWTHYNTLSVKKNRSYWDQNSVDLNGIDMGIVADPATDLALFEKGEIDWCGAPLSQIPLDALSSAKQVISHPVAGVEWYQFNTEKFPFHNPKMRRAFALAIDKEALLQAFSPEQYLAADSFVPPPLSLQNKTAPFDPAAAKILFQEALEELGIEKLPSVRLAYNVMERHYRTAQVVQEQWRKVLGVTVEFEPLEYKVYWDKLMMHDYQIGRMGWIAFGFRDPINFLQIFREKEGWNNHTRWASPLFSKNLEESFGQADPEQRLALLKNAESILLEETPLIPLYFITNTYLKNPRLQGVYLSDLGEIDFKWARFTDR